MSLKLRFDPQRAVRLRKNDLLNELRTKLSQKIYEVFQEAEKGIWDEQLQDIDFVEEICREITTEISNLKGSYNEKLKAWQSVERIESAITNPVVQPAKDVIVKNAPKPNIPATQPVVQPKIETTKPKNNSPFISPPAPKEDVNTLFDEFDLFDDFDDPKPMPEKPRKNSSLDEDEFTFFD
jgi:hypothetical protein